MNFTTEGCFCPDGMKLFNRESGVCVDKCGKTDVLDFFVFNSVVKFLQWLFMSLQDVWTLMVFLVRWDVSFACSRILLKYRSLLGSVGDLGSLLWFIISVQWEVRVQMSKLHLWGVYQDCDVQTKGMSASTTSKLHRSWICPCQPNESSRQLLSCLRVP